LKLTLVEKLLSFVAVIVVLCIGWLLQLRIMGKLELQ